MGITNELKDNKIEFLPYDMLRLIFLLVASLESTSLRMDIVEMLSDLKYPSPFL